MYNVVSIVDNTALYDWNLLKEWYIYQIIILYTLNNLHFCQLYFNKYEKKKSKLKVRELKTLHL